MQAKTDRLHSRRTFASTPMSGWHAAAVIAYADASDKDLLAAAQSILAVSLFYSKPVKQVPMVLRAPNEEPHRTHEHSLQAEFV